MSAVANFNSLLVASGLHTLSLSFRAYFDIGVLKGTGIAGVGLEKLRWFKPVRPGDTIRVKAEVLSKRLTSHAGRGILIMQIVSQNQNDQTVMECELNVLVARRNCGT